MLTNEKMLGLTAFMPMKQINLVTQVSLNSDGFDLPRLDWATAGDAPPTHRPFTKDVYTSYLQRYFAGTFRDGVDLWLHRFLSNDGDRHLHNHPFEFATVMLCGGYTEDYMDSNGDKEWRITTPCASSDLPKMIDAYLSRIHAPIVQARPTSEQFLHSAGEHRKVGVFDWHRIAAVNPETWTAVLVKRPRLPKWYFKDDDGDIQDMRASARDWFKNYNVRPQSGIATNDNRRI
ncbi:MAG: hypothetical protein ABW044_05415 [Cellvibrio sp.]